MVAERVAVKGKLHEYVHFGGFLGCDQLPVVRNLQFLQSKKGEVGKYAVEGQVVAVGR